MKNFKAMIQSKIINLICDDCGLEASVDEGYEFSEFISIEHRCGYGAIHGDGKQFSIDLCQHCFAKMCGDTLTITDSVNNQTAAAVESPLEYDNIFQAITQSKQDANELKQKRNIRVSASDILSANNISSQEELHVALRRVEQLWDAKYHSSKGNELHKLADLICAYENKKFSH